MALDRLQEPSIQGLPYHILSIRGLILIPSRGIKKFGGLRRIFIPFLIPFCGQGQHVVNTSPRRAPKYLNTPDSQRFLFFMILLNRFQLHMAWCRRKVAAVTSTAAKLGFAAVTSRAGNLCLKYDQASMECVNITLDASHLMKLPSDALI